MLLLAPRKLQRATERREALWSELNTTERKGGDSQGPKHRSDATRHWHTCKQGPGEGSHCGLESELKGQSPGS